jgi:hypothetical protein
LYKSSFVTGFVSPLEDWLSTTILIERERQVAFFHLPWCISEKAWCISHFRGAFFNKAWCIARNRGAFLKNRGAKGSAWFTSNSC